MNRLRTLDQPISFVRLKTTSFNLHDARIIEIVLCKMKAGKVIDKFESLLDPEISFSIDAQNYTGISEEMVKGKPKFQDIAERILDFFVDNCAIAGYRVIQFDIPLLIKEFKRCCKANVEFFEELPVIDLQVIFRRFHLGLAQVFRYYTKKSLGERHNSLSDVKAMQMILNTQMEWYNELFDVDSINHFCLQPDRFVDRYRKLRYDVEGQIVLNFGKYLGKKIREVKEKDPGYLWWIVKKGDFSKQVKQVCKEVLCKANSPPAPSLKKRGGMRGR